MAKLIKNIDIYTGVGVVKNGFLRFSNKIEEIGEAKAFVTKGDDQVITVPKGAIIVPGFIDVHTHGGYGFDTMDADVDGLNRFMENLRREGLTSVFPTTITQTKDNIKKALVSVAEAAKNNSMIRGIHLEGPFINANMNGAQPAEYVIRPDLALFKNWQKDADGLIKLVTYAPEKSGSAFEAGLHNMGVVLSAGHTNQSYFKMNKGQTLASHVTHLYNRQSQLEGREPGVTGYGVLTPSIKVEVIADGVHVSPEMIKLAYQLKGAKNIEVITDSMRAKGQKENEVSELGGQKVIVKNGAARLENGHLAGSVLKYILAFRNIQKFTGASIEEAVLMTSVNQAREFGLNDVGSLEVGKRANFNLLNSDQDLLENFLDGDGLKAVDQK
ncbi:N-acetylglucosamine-6-phosphate deacetylase [Oenococcus oeni]|uniref:N-acetylglucosamine-6-phosphate deacetylase n=2 Tax=Oenococcus oeni TaxID=1247 RepID=UPI000277B278|nr:N-acetylglucosamine-6-phosphate deacetylase [Oenococcus oeni]AWW98914.1 N-acetylglucosamine-6-phosphate deacetylase [Oenococcus oeni]EJO01235.1 N-acetylglucosamine 6-phosphate deacetylase [Oenococcus oeni AWRIB419]KEK01991.1 N-acetylglucosamine-6-phosphate deacetylase [Oenococcus oeni]KER92978.1 N-acetylglucosamine-6-phosphate deacetylase [Oenococcus oeni]KER94992.1 N-acetylglucosamine-6-phosphate deacetylase [Oenococcus oeni]